MIERYWDQITDADKQLYYLAKRLWDDLFRLKEQYCENALVPLEVSSEELELIRAALRDYLLQGNKTGFLCIREHWGASGFQFLTALLFARYSQNSEPHFWEALQAWACGDQTPQKDVKQPEAYNSFCEKKQIFLYRATNKRRQHKSSLQTHAIIVPESARKILDGLKYLVFGRPYYVDEDEMIDLLDWFVEEAGSSISLEDVDEENGSHDRDLENVRVSFFLTLPRPFRRACRINPGQVATVLRPLYRAVEQLLLELQSDDRESRIPNDVPWQLRSALDAFYQSIDKDQSREISLLLKRSGGKRRYRRPDFFLDSEIWELQLLMPAQRIVTDDDDPDVHFHVSGDGFEFNHPAELIDIGSWYLTEEVAIPLPVYSKELTIDIVLGQRSLRTFSVRREYLLFHNDGEVITNPRPTPEGVLLVVPTDTSLEADEDVDFIAENRSAAFKIYASPLDENSYFIIGDSLIAPIGKNVPEIRFHESTRVVDVWIEDEDRTLVPVYSSFPAISFRAATSGDPTGFHKLVINSESMPYTVTRDVLIPDGSGDSVYTIIPTDEALRSIPEHAFLNVETTNTRGGTFRLVVLGNFKYQFAEPFYLRARDLRVDKLSFNESNSLLNGNYTFPMQGTSRFRVLISNAEHRLQLPAPVVTWRFSDGSDVPEHIHLNDIGIDLAVETRFKRCTLMITAEQREERIRPEKGSSLKFDLSPIKNVFADTIKIELDLGNVGAQEDAPRVPITTIHRRFTLLGEPLWEYDDGTSKFRAFHREPGQYVVLHAVYDSNAKYVASVVSTNDDYERARFELQDLGPRQHFLVSHAMIEDGEYVLMIYRVNDRFGSTATEIREVFRTEPFVLRGGRRMDPNDPRGLLLKGESALQTVVVPGSGARKRKVPIANFFLEVRDHQTNATEGWFYADGFFHLSDRIQQHTLFNPYQIKMLENRNGRYRLMIRDKDGNPISVDGDGHVNDLKASRSFRSKEIITVVTTERDHGGKNAI